MVDCIPVASARARNNDECINNELFTHTYFGDCHACMEPWFDQINLENNNEKRKKNRTKLDD